MKQYKDNNEAAKSYADLLYREQNNNQQKLQHEAACLDFAAGANWKEEQLRLSAVMQRSEQLFAFLEYCDNAGWIKNVDKKRIIEDYEKANNCA